MYRSFKRFAHCDEGGIAEAYSDSVGRLLARDWKHLDAFVRLTSDPDFEEFVIRHIDETMSEDEAALVINNARLHCPPGAKRLCRSIADYYPPLQKFSPRRNIASYVSTVPPRVQAALRLRSGRLSGCRLGIW